MSNNNNNEDRIVRPKRYVIQLDGDPYHMWDEPARDFKPKVKEVERYINKMLSGSWVANAVVSSVQSTLGTLARLGLVKYSKELKGLSHSLGIPLGTLVSMQLIYEASTCCTSILCRSKESPSNDENGNIVLARTMDWAMDILKDITIEVDFQRNGESVVKATTWMGYVGVLTGVSKNGFAISINYRRTNDGSFLTNIKELAKYSWPVGYLVREALIECTDYTAALSALETSKIVAPCYMTIAGRDRGVVLARNTHSVFRKSVLPSQEQQQDNQNNNQEITNNNYLVQTNNEEKNDDDHDFLYSNDRRCLSKRVLDRLPETNRSDDQLWKLFSTHPVQNEDTIYGCIMKPNDFTLETRIPTINGFQ